MSLIPVAAGEVNVESSQPILDRLDNPLPPVPYLPLMDDVVAEPSLLGYPRIPDPTIGVDDFDTIPLLSLVRKRRLRGWIRWLRARVGV